MSRRTNTAEILVSNVKPANATRSRKPKLSIVPPSMDNAPTAPPPSGWHSLVTLTSLKKIAPLKALPTFETIVEPIAQNHPVTEPARAMSTIGTPGDARNTLFEKNPCAMWSVNPITMQILAANHAATTIYGYSAEQFVGMDLGDLQWTNDVQASNPNGKQLRFVTKDGAPKRVRITAGSMRFGARDVRFFICANDSR